MLYSVDMLFTSGERFVLPKMDESFVTELNYAKSRNEVFSTVDRVGNHLVIDTAHITLIRSNIISA